MHDLSPALIISLLLLASMAAQWLAWRLHLPALLLLSAFGVLLGPVSGVMDPKAALGEVLAPLVSLAVAVILFDGGLNLRLAELRETRQAVKQLVFAGALLSWGLLGLAGHYVVGLSWPVAAMFGGLLVVTGPTVIMPMLRQARLNSRVASVLKWEGIVIDPVGAMFAVLTYEYLTSPELRHSPIQGGAVLLGEIALIMVVSYVVARVLEWLYAHGHVPEFLKAPLVLVCVIAGYSAANLLLDEGGLIAVTVLGITLANTRMQSIEEIRRIKEYLSLFLVSLLFLTLTATLTWTDLMQLDWRAALLVAVIFAVRFIVVMVSTLGTKLTLKERLMVGWIAPRGVVCVAVAGLFGPLLVEAGYPDGERLVPLAFCVVFATVIAHGLSIRRVGRYLGLTAANSNGVIIVGGNPWSTKLAIALKKRDINVLLADDNWHHLREARLAEVPIYYGQIMSEDATQRIEFNAYGALLATTDNYAYNSLVCARYAHVFGRDRVFQLPDQKDEETDPKAFSHTVRGQSLFGEQASYEDLLYRHYQHWDFANARLSDEHPYEEFLRYYGDDAIPIAAITPTGQVRFATTGRELTAEPGEVVLAYVQQQAEEEEAQARQEKHAQEHSAKDAVTG